MVDFPALFRDSVTRMFKNVGAKIELRIGRNGSIFQSFLHASLAFIATRAKKAAS